MLVLHRLAVFFGKSSHFSKSIMASVGGPAASFLPVRPFNNLYINTSMTASRKAQDFALVEAAGWAPVGVGIPQFHKGMSSAVAAPLSRPLFFPNHAGEQWSGFHRRGVPSLVDMALTAYGLYAIVSL